MKKTRVQLLIALLILLLFGLVGELPAQIALCLDAEDLDIEICDQPVTPLEFKDFVEITKEGELIHFEYSVDTDYIFVVSIAQENGDIIDVWSFMETPFGINTVIIPTDYVAVKCYAVKTSDQSEHFTKYFQ